MDKFKNKYRIASARLPKWDYGSNAMYFVTICTMGRECYFGYVENGLMILSEIGKIARECWQNIPIHFPFIELGEFVIMPNHIHGIIIIEKINGLTGGATVETPNLGVSTFPPSSALPLVSRPPFSPLSAQPLVPPSTPCFQPTSVTPSDPIVNANRNRTFNASQKWKPATLGVVINQYKRAVTINARKIRIGFAWQSRYYDQIIRDNKSHENIRNYINNNPENWNKDNFKK